MKNPKMKKVPMVACRPQTGECPIRCAECFFNSKGYYEDKTKPLIPTAEEASRNLVRVNDGHDSNIEFPKVIEVTRPYRYKFFNTSIPKLFFNEPTVLTINSKDKTFIHPSDISGHISTLMAVRFRVSTWNVPLCLTAIETYRSENINVPFLLTDMRYKRKASILSVHRFLYEKKRHISNTYYRVNKSGLAFILSLTSNHGVYWCGNPFTGSTYCADCQLCFHFYCATKARSGNNMFKFTSVDTSSGGR